MLDNGFVSKYIFTFPGSRLDIINLVTQNHVFNLSVWNIRINIPVHNNIFRYLYTRGTVISKEQ